MIIPSSRFTKVVQHKKFVYSPYYKHLQNLVFAPCDYANIIESVKNKSKYRDFVSEVDLENTIVRVWGFSIHSYISHASIEFYLSGNLWLLDSITDTVQLLYSKDTPYTFDIKYNNKLLTFRKYDKKNWQGMIDYQYILFDSSLYWLYTVLVRHDA